MHALLTLAYGLLFLAIIQRWRFFTDSGVPVRWLQGFFLLKVVFGLGLWAIYTYHYTYRDTSDAFRYFDNAMVVFSAMGDDPLHYLRMMTGVGMDHPGLEPYFVQINGWSKAYNYGIINDNPTIIRINALIALFSQGYYHVHTVFMCFFSLLGCTALYRGFHAELPRHRIVLITAVFLLPSVLFWTSGVLKEAPLFLFVGMFTWALLGLTRGQLGWRHLLVLVLSLTGLVFLKMYVLVAMTPAILLAVMIAATGRRNIGLKTAVVLVFTLAAAVNSGRFLPGGDVLYILGKKQTDFYNVAQMQSAGSVVDIPRIDGWGAFRNSSPQYLYNTYFRPDVSEVEGPFYLALAVENALILGLIVLSLLFWGWRKEGAFIRQYCLLFVLAYGLIVGSTVPILGAIVRYKVVALPFLLVIILSGGLGRKLELWMAPIVQGRK